MVPRGVLEIVSQHDRGAHAVRERLACAFPHVEVACADASAEAEVHVAEWLHPALDLLSIDRRVHDAQDAARPVRHALRLRITGCERPEAPAVAVQFVTRYQRLFLRPSLLEDARFRELLARHAHLYDLRKPLVRADYDHALDVLQWVERLCPQASLSLRVAALFHDVERLYSEPDKRVEQHARDYQAFKDAHAERGSEILRAHLHGLLSEAELGASCRLVREHEHVGRNAELLLLNDADALSFFSLNSAGFFAYFGEFHTRKKVRYTLSRMRPEAWRYLHQLRLSADVARLLDEAL